MSIDDRPVPEPEEHDPVCDMVVDLEQAEEHGLTLLHESVAYGFCSPTCLEAFARDALRYVPAGGRDVP